MCFWDIAVLRWSDIAINEELLETGLNRTGTGFFRLPIEVFSEPPMRFAYPFG